MCLWHSCSYRWCRSCPCERRRRSCTFLLAVSTLPFGRTRNLPWPIVIEFVLLAIIHIGTSLFCFTITTVGMTCLNVNRVQPPLHLVVASHHHQLPIKDKAEVNFELAKGRNHTKYWKTSMFGYLVGYRRSVESGQDSEKAVEPAPMSAL